MLSPVFFSLRSTWQGLSNRLPLLAVLCLWSMAAAAVNTPMEKARVDFRKVNALYQSTPSYSLDIQYSVFDSHTGGNLVEQKMGKYIRYKDMSYSKILDIETVINPQTTIIVNHEDRFIVITDTRKMELSPLQTNMDTLLKLCSQIQVKDIGTSERHYTLSFEEDKGEFSKIELSIDLGNYSIRKMVLYYNEEMPLTENDYYAKDKKPRLEINYKAFVVVKAVNETLFLESTYVSKTNDTYKGKGKSMTYEIINQLRSARFKKK